MYKITLAILLNLLLLNACSNSTNTNNSATNQQTEKEATITPDNDLPDVSGVWKLSADSGCDIVIKLTPDETKYKYQITGNNLNANGIATVEKINEAYYVIFDGQIANNPPKTVEGLIDDNLIMIQNYGNSMNEYNHFENCDAKYLEFRR